MRVHNFGYLILAQQRLSEVELADIWSLEDRAFRFWYSIFRDRGPKVFVCVMDFGRRRECSRASLPLRLLAFTEDALKSRLGVQTSWGSRSLPTARSHYYFTFLLLLKANSTVSLFLGACV